LCFDHFAHEFRRDAKLTQFDDAFKVQFAEVKLFAELSHLEHKFGADAEFSEFDHVFKTQVGQASFGDLTHEPCADAKFTEFDHLLEVVLAAACVARNPDFNSRFVFGTVLERACVRGRVRLGILERFEQFVCLFDADFAVFDHLEDSGASGFHGCPFVRLMIFVGSPDEVFQVIKQILPDTVINVNSLLMRFASRLQKLINRSENPRANPELHMTSSKAPA
jgi:hypothetical protein